MRARLALAQALLPGPALLILDEPGSGLDPEGIAEMRQTILRLHKELGLTILLSSHLLHEVEQLCTHIAVLKQGRKVFEGPMSSIARHEPWVRLRTDDFARAAAELTAAGLIIEHREGKLLRLADAADTSVVVKFLVEQKFAVHEIIREEETLEGFYLSLMSADRGGEAKA
jgi:ABC-2 type transport system ATP-binding protein